MENKKVKVKKKMPYDFWNYNVNPVTGYYVPKKKIDES
jgi:hypothetical protein